MSFAPSLYFIKPKEQEIPVGMNERRRVLPLATLHFRSLDLWRVSEREASHVTKFSGLF